MTFTFRIIRSEYVTGFDTSTKDIEKTKIKERRMKVRQVILVPINGSHKGEQNLLNNSGNVPAKRYSMEISCRHLQLPVI